MGWSTGLEPATSRTTIWGSTIELRPPAGPHTSFPRRPRQFRRQSRHRQKPDRLSLSVVLVLVLVFSNGVRGRGRERGRGRIKSLCFTEFIFLLKCLHGRP